VTASPADRGLLDEGGDLRFGRQRAARVLQRAGVHAEDREPMGQDVVRLPPDPPALGLARGVLRALPQLTEELALGADEQPPPTATAVSSSPTVTCHA
jgi:hypothetical protein